MSEQDNHFNLASTFVEAKLKLATDLHIIAIIDEMGEQLGFLTAMYCDEIIQGMITHGSSPDIHFDKQLHERIQARVVRCVLIVAAERWRDIKRAAGAA